MTKPRKDQVRNLKTEFKSHPNGEIVVSYGGATTQQIDGGALNIFTTGRTLTKKVGGASQNCPARIYGSVGPWAVSAGASFTVQIPGVNNELPMVVTVQTSDLIRNGGVLLLSSSALAKRINTDCGLFSVSDGTELASVVDGRLVFCSRDDQRMTVGSAAYVTLAAITPNILSVLGISSSASVTAFGTDGSTRGVVTESVDGLGGYMQLRTTADKTVPYTGNASLHRTYSPSGSNGSPYVNEPDEDPRAPIFGRIRRSRTVNGDSLELQYFQKTSSLPHVDLGDIDPSKIDATDSITVYVGTATGVEFGYNVNFATNASQTFQTLADSINNGWNNFPGNVTNPRQGNVAFLNRGPYSISATTDFSISFNGQAPINISLAGGTTWTNSTLMAYIAAAITAAGQSSQGQATLGNNALLRSLQVSGPTSTVTIAAPNSRFTEHFGILPGTYRGWDLATVVGGDILRIQGPNRGGSIRLTADGVNTYARGFNITSPVVSVVKACPATPPAVDLQIPESMEFWEVPDSNETDEADFSNLTPDRKTTAASGWNATTASSLLGPNGKIPGAFLPSSYTNIRVDTLYLDSSPELSFGVDSTKAAMAKIFGLAGTTPDTWNTVMEFQPYSAYSATDLPSRLLAASDGIVLTVNAKRGTGGIVKDTTSFTSSILEFRNGTLSMGTHVGASPFVNANWVRNFAVADTVEFTKTLTLGKGDNSLPADVARVSIPRRNTTTGNTPSGNNRYTLIFESLANGANANLPLRMYMTTSLNPLTEEANGFMFTINAKWDMTLGQWGKDVTSERAIAWMMGSQAYTGGNQQSGIYMYAQDSNVWTSWNKIGSFINKYTPSGGDDGTVTMGSDPLTILNAKTIVKSWGQLNCNVSPLITGYNVQLPTRSGVGNYGFSFVSAVASPTMMTSQRQDTAFLATRMVITSGYCESPGPGVPASGGSIFLMQYSAGTPTYVDNYKVNFIVMGGA